MSQTPKFLMNGIRFQNNFLGWTLVKTSGYTVIEVAARSLFPMVLAIQLAQQNRQMVKFIGNPVSLTTPIVDAEVRRSSLTE